MARKEIEIVVFGTDQLCPSCVNLPSSKETFEWLQAAISRKYPNQPFIISYVDIYNPPLDQKKQAFANRVNEEGMFYPVVTIGDVIVGEGNPKLKTIYKEMEKYGYTAN
jgi:disulfide oxidoreductase YuzD